jgi:hypothetical protein
LEGDETIQGNGLVVQLETMRRRFRTELQRPRLRRPQPDPLRLQPVRARRGAAQDEACGAVGEHLCDAAIGLGLPRGVRS